MIEESADLLVPSPYLQGSVVEWATTETRHGRATHSEGFTWGRKVLQAVASDRCADLGELIDPKKNPQADLNLQTTPLGYDGYVWTVAIHRHLGDTALHFALKQRKLLCVYLLLFMGADPTIANEEGVTPLQLLQRQYNTDHRNMLYDARRYIINNINPLDIKRLPAKFGCAGIEREAWRLIDSGRVLFHDLPLALKPDEVSPHVVSMRTRRRLSFNSSVPKVPYSWKSKDAKSKPTLAEVMTRAVADGDAPWRNVEVTVRLGNSLSRQSSTNPVSGPLALEGSATSGSYEEQDEDESVEQGVPLPRPFVPRTFSLDSDEKISEGSSLVLSAAIAMDESKAWVEQIAADGRVYYYNTLSGTSSWDPPPPPPLEQLISKGSRDPSVARDSEEKSVGSNQTSVVMQPQPRPPLFIEDVWTKSSLQDVVDLIERQKRNREKMHAKAPALPVLYGLSLLSSVKVGSQLERLNDQETLLAGGERGALERIYAEYKTGGEQPAEQLLQAKGVKNLKFVTISAMERTMSSISRVGEERLDEEASLSSLRASRKHLVASPHVIADSILYSESSLPSRRFNAPGSTKSDYTVNSAAPALSPYLEALFNPAMSARIAGPSGKSRGAVSASRSSFVSNASGGTTPGKSAVFNPTSSSVKLRGAASGVAAPPTGPASIAVADADELNNVRDLYREVTEISTFTNLKYLAIGDDGANRLSHALYLDPCIVKLTLANAHIGDAGCSALADVLPSMKGLIYLDLSGNCIGEVGMIALAEGLQRSYNTANNSVSAMQASFGSSDGKRADGVARANSLISTVTSLSVAGNRSSLEGIVQLVNCLEFSSSRQARGVHQRHRLYWLSVHNNALNRQDIEVLSKVLEEKDYLPVWPWDRDIPSRLAQRVEDTADLYGTWPKDCIVMSQALDKESRILYQHWLSLADEGTASADDVGAAPGSMAQASSWMMSVSKIGSQFSQPTDADAECKEEPLGRGAGGIVVL